MREIRKGETMNEIKKLSSIIINDSLKVRRKEKVLIISDTDKPALLIKEFIKDISKNEGIPFVEILFPSIESLLLEKTTEERIKQISIIEEQKINNFDTFIYIKYTKNEFETIDIDPQILKNKGNALEKINQTRVNERKWILLNYPSELDAYKAKMNTDKYFQYALEVMTVDYNQMKQDIVPLLKLMEKTDKVRILSPNTDLTFSIKDIPIIPCCGECNIPDGEIYTAPVKNSVNGIITYNVPSVYHGNMYHNIQLTFENGKIIQATSDDNNNRLNEIFNTDDGSRYVGEFSLGLNPKILHPVGNILYDEKIIGSLHFTPGSSYHNAYNGNQSVIHWDLVLIQRKEYGGGEIYFDDILIRKDGMFVLPELQHLNYLSK
jgi:hypothetical protein